MKNEQKINNFVKNQVPSIVSVMISTDIQPGFGRSTRVERKELENECECNYQNSERHPKL